MFGRVCYWHVYQQYYYTAYMCNIIVFWNIEMNYYTDHDECTKWNKYIHNYTKTYLHKIKVSNSTPFDTIQHHMTPYIWCQDTKRHHSTLVCFFKFWQKMMIFQKICQKLMIFQIFEKKYFFLPNLCQSWWFFKFLQVHVYWSKFIKKWWFFKFWT